ncbi:hypothetical protein chiPu_0023100 [Chiloscyllium punctatum]|uniref:Uncharacterized protein n=1 Tax=Chiloscyllium punctatum TaxID=137246 RepID=A0A401T8Q8_CHIPU|nr:hypothetical protein [Chiloscyllium punctatum]
MELFVTLLNEKLGTFLDMTFHSLCPNKQSPIFGDFMRGDVYEDLTNFKALKMYMEHQLNEYNSTPGVVPMSLVLFKDAIEHGKHCKMTPAPCTTLHTCMSKYG